MFKNYSSLFNNKWIVALLFLPFIQPTYLGLISIVNKIYSLTQIIVFLLVILLLYLSGKRISLFTLTATIFLVTRVFLTYIYNPSYLISSIHTNVVILSLILITELGLKSNSLRLLQAINFVFCSLVIINFVLMLIYPQGVYIDNPRVNEFRIGYFLGIDNHIAVYLLPASTILLITSILKRKKVTLFPKIIILIILLTLIKVWSVTALISIFIYLCLMLFATLPKLKNMITIYRFSIAYLFLWLLVVILQNLSFARVLIENVFNKSMTLSYRTIIWNSAFKMIRQSPIFGYGMKQQGAFVPIGNTFASSHNILLQIMLETGIFGLTLLIIIYFFSIKQLQSYRKYAFSRYLTIGLFAVLLTFLTEANELNYLFILLTISANIKVIINQSLLNKNKDIVED